MDSFGVGRTSDPCEQELDSNLPERGVSVFDPSVACVVGVLLGAGCQNAYCFGAHGISALAGFPGNFSE